MDSNTDTDIEKLNAAIKLSDKKYMGKSIGTEKLLFFKDLEVWILNLVDMKWTKTLALF
jgi:hypothetical protein